jgi:hypothetical protein
MPNKSVFLSIGKVALFRELQAGQLAPVYIMNKYDFNVLIPREMEQLISDPEIALNMLYFVRRSQLATSSDLIPGVFKFQVASSLSGFTFVCEYDPMSKVFDKIQFSYDTEYDFYISGLTVQQFMDLFHKDAIEVVHYLLGTSQPEGKRLQLESFLT